MSYIIRCIEFAEAFDDLAQDQKQWSEATFGSDAERGPMGALKHLEMEAREAQASPHNVCEYADCLLLLLDAARRAGFKPMTLVQAAIAKMEVNKRRTWPKPISDEPVEHIKQSP